MTLPPERYQNPTDMLVAGWTMLSPEQQTHDHDPFTCPCRGHLHEWKRAEDQIYRKRVANRYRDEFKARGDRLARIVEAFMGGRCGDVAVRNCLRDYHAPLNIEEDPP